MLKRAWTSTRRLPPNSTGSSTSALSALVPAPKKPSDSVSRHLARDWWERAEEKAGLEPKKGRGWHSLRRKFASDLVDEPLKVLADLGGWKNTQTIVECYQRPDQERLRAALLARTAAGGT